MLGAIPLWLHIFAATVWIGSQVMMFAVVIPSVRAVDDPSARSQLMVEVTARLGWVGVAALVVLIATGIDNYDRYAPAGVFGFRYGFVLTAKLSLFAAVVALTGVHTLVIGPRLLSLQEQATTLHEIAVEEAVRNLRRQSFTISGAIFLLSLAVLFCAALLRTPWSLHSA